MYSRYFIWLLLSTGVSQFIQVRLNFAPGPNHLPFLGSTEIYQDTPGPVDIVLKDTTFVETKPLLILNELCNKVILNQTGQSVEVQLSQQHQGGKITGGVLYDDVYKFHKLRFYWHNNATSDKHYAATTVDGKEGTQLEALFSFFNMKYGSFRNALNYRNGLALVSTRISVMGDKPNPLFSHFQYKMKKIKKPGDFVHIYSAFVSSWLDFYLPDEPYYAYPGSFPDEDTGKTFYCTTTIILPLVKTNFISKGQFKETFGSLVDCSGRPLINAAPQYPRGSLPIVRSKGIKIIPVLK